MGPGSALSPAWRVAPERTVRAWGGQSYESYGAGCRYVNESSVEAKWYVVDAENQVVGRLASQVAAMLRGKHKPEYTPHVDTGDFIVVVNAERARFTGAKETAKEYFRHSGYPGGVTTMTPKVAREKKPTFIIENAVKGTDVFRRPTAWYWLGAAIRGY